METSQKDVRMEYQNLQSKHNTEVISSIELFTQRIMI